MQTYFMIQFIGFESTYRTCCNFSSPECVDYFDKHQIVDLVFQSSSAFFGFSTKEMLTKKQCTFCEGPRWDVQKLYGLFDLLSARNG